MNKINHAHVVNETNQTNQTNHLRLGSRTHAAIWKVQGYGLVLITFLSFFPILFHLEEYLFFTLLTIAFAVAWLDGRPIWVRTPIDLPLLLFVGWVLLTIPFAIDAAYSFAEWRKLVAQVLVFYWVLSVLQVQGSRTVRYRVMPAVVIGTAALCSYALIDFLVSGGTLETRDVRARAPNSDSNWLTTYMVIAIPLMAAMSFSTRNFWQRLVYACVFCLSLSVQFIAYMRAGWVSLLVQGVALGVIIGGRRLGTLALVCCLVGVLGLFALSEVGYLQSVFDPTSFHYRLEVWQLGIAEVMKHPIVGLGYGNDTLDKRFEDYWKTGRGPILHSPHNTFLMVGMGSGIPALILLIWVLVSAVRSLLYGATKVSDGKRYALMIGIALLIIGFTTRNLFDYMFAGSLAYLFWILVAVGMSEAVKPRAPERVDGHMPSLSPLGSYS